MGNVLVGRIVILDAGSSGTRFYAYQWQQDGLAPKVTLAYEGKKVPGAIENNTTQPALNTYLDEIFIPAVQAPAGNLLQKFGDITVNELRDVPIFVLGTAGMRVFKRDHPAEHEQLKGWIEAYITARNEYRAPTYETINGEDEAAYGWVAANFLLGAFSTEYETSARDTVGYLEMGGQSAQIAFRPFENELTPDKLHDGDITTVTLGEKSFDLVLKTWDLGSNQGWREYQSDVVAAGTRLPGQSDGDTTIYDPDSPYMRKWEYSEPVEFGNQPDPYKLEGYGTFNSQRFHEKVLKVLDRLSQPAPARGSRLLDENLVAAIKARRFVGGANFWYSTRGVFGRKADLKGSPKTTVFSFEEYLAEVKSTTELSWPLLQLRLRHKSEDVMGNAWFVAEWVNCVLVNGFGFTFTDQPSVQRADDLSFRPFGGTAKAELTWTLGRAVLEAYRALAPVPNAPVQLVTRPGLRIVVERHQAKLTKAMIEKAIRSEELLWDYIVMAASFGNRIGSDPASRGNAARAKRMRALAETAAYTSRSLRREAGQPVPPEVVVPEGEQSKVLDPVMEKVMSVVSTIILEGGYEKHQTAHFRDHINKYRANNKLDDLARMEHDLAQLPEKVKENRENTLKEIKELVLEVKRVAGAPLTTQLEDYN